MTAGFLAKLFRRKSAGQTIPAISAGSQVPVIVELIKPLPNGGRIIAVMPDDILSIQDRDAIAAHLVGRLHPDIKNSIQIKSGDSQAKARHARYGGQWELETVHDTKQLKLAVRAASIGTPDGEPINLTLTKPEEVLSETARIASAFGIEPKALVLALCSSSAAELAAFGLTTPEVLELGEKILHVRNSTHRQALP